MSSQHEGTPGLEANPGTDSPEELQQLAELVADALAKGEDHEQIVGDLVSNGWDERSAKKFVRSVEQMMHAPQQQHHGGDEGGGLGWLIWIGVLILINGLSYVFNWGFWLY